MQLFTLLMTRTERLLAGIIEKAGGGICLVYGLLLVMINITIGVLVFWLRFKIHCSKS